MALQLLGNRVLGFVAKRYQAMVVSRLNQYGENSQTMQVSPFVFLDPAVLQPARLARECLVVERIILTSCTWI
jgi:hypothetical protein